MAFALLRLLFDGLSIAAFRYWGSDPHTAPPPVADYDGGRRRGMAGSWRLRRLSEMTDSELNVGLAFHGISCVAAFAVLLYMRRKAEET